MRLYIYNHPVDPQASSPHSDWPSPLVAEFQLGRTRELNQIQSPMDVDEFLRNFEEHQISATISNIPTTTEEETAATSTTTSGTEDFPGLLNQNHIFHTKS